jgi:hypothetical protein
MPPSELKSILLEIDRASTRLRNVLQLRFASRISAAKNPVAKPTILVRLIQFFRR